MEKLSGEHLPQTDAVVAIDDQGTIVLFDAVAERLFGYDAAEVLGRNITALMPEEYRSRHEEQLVRYITTGESHILGGEIHVEALRRDGARVPMALRVTELVRGDTDRLFVAALCDLEARRLLQEKLWYREVFDLAMVGIVLVTPEGRFRWSNRRAAEIFGYEVEELQARRFQDLTHPAHLAADVESTQDLLAGALPFYETDTRYLRKDGSIVWVRLWTRVLRNTEGSPLYFVSILEDIDKRKRAEEADRTTLSLLRATLESTADGIFVVDLHRRVVLYNQRFAAMWHVPESILKAGDDEALIAHVLPQLVDPEGYVERIRELYESPSAESFDVLEFVDGRAFERYSRPQILGDEIVGRVWRLRDVTSHRRAEEKLRRSQELFAHAQKMEAIGRLAGGVAHDFNNLLSVITGYANILARSLPEDDRWQGLIRPIAAAVDRAAALTTQLLAFSRRQPRKVAVLDLNRVVRDVEEMLARLLGEGIVVETTLDPELWPIFADRGQIEQVMVNLAVNARDAMSKRGLLHIATSNVRGDGAPAAVRLALTDTGVGMDKETLAHIFEPFFTTKGPDQGTGLGLSTVHGIVEQSGGTIEVESAPGRGTTFTVLLPPSRGHIEEASIPERGQAECERGRETILVLEDHAELRGLVRAILESHGYRVLVSDGRGDAVEAARSERVDLLVADVILPRASGPEVAAALKAEHPNLVVLYVSGYPELHGKAIFDANAPFLAKPFTPEALARKVREVLDG